HHHLVRVRRRGRGRCLRRVCLASFRPRHPRRPLLRLFARHPDRPRLRAGAVRGHARAARGRCPRLRMERLRHPGAGMTDPSLLDRIQADLATAMKSQDKDTLSTLRMLKSSLMEAKTRKAKDAALSRDEEMEVLQRYLKKRRETIEEMRRVGREDRVASEEAEIVVTQRYLPQGLSEDELRAVVRETVVETGASSPKE